MSDERWPRKVWEWTPPYRRKKGGPKHSWKMDVANAMNARGLAEARMREAAPAVIKSQKKEKIM